LSLKSNSSNAMKAANLMDLYSDYLLTSPGSVSALTLVEVLNKAYSHDALTRMLAQPEIEQKVFWKKIKPFIRQVECDYGVISIDDSIEHKPHSAENALISWHFDHSKGEAVKGINFVSFTYVTQYGETKIKAPLAWELVRKDKLVEKTEKKDGKFITRQVRQASVSKIELVKKRLDILINHNRLKCKYIVFDSWYSASELMTYVCDLGKHFVCALKDNRMISFDLGEGSEKSKTWIAVGQAELEPQRAYQVRVKGVPFTLNLLKKVYHNLDGSLGVQYLLCSDTMQDEEQIDQIYKNRWASEDLHRSLKQNTALEKMPAKLPESQSNHIFASMLAQVKLEALKINTKQNHYALKKNILIEALKTAWKIIQELKEQALEKNIAFPNFSPA